MGLFRIKTTECRVGVVGTSFSGKTVLLTSLINHLKDYDPSRFKLGDERQPAHLRKFRTLPPDEGWDAFPYEAARDALVNRGRWPQKTRDRAAYTCQFERSDWTFSDTLLKLYDLPGERIADAAMLGMNYATWSDHILKLFQSDHSYRRCTEDFLAAIERPVSEPGPLLRAYRLALANLILHFKPMISPSTFLLDQQGTLAKPVRDGSGQVDVAKSIEELADNRFCGLSASEQFCPLPANLRSPGSEILAAFTTRYKAYTLAVVLPAILTLKSCTSLIVLVDVPMLLAGGVGMYDDNRQIIEDLLKVLEPGETPLWGPMARGLEKVFLPHGWRSGRITRIAFTAPKADLVHPLDRDHVLRLLRTMVGRIAGNFDGLHSQFFNCSAIVSTKMLPSPTGERLLVGIPYRDPQGNRLPPGPEARFATSTVPDDWPQEWQPGRFVFPEVYPHMPARKDHPPEQVNLDRIATFVIE